MTDLSQLLAEQRKVAEGATKGGWWWRGGYPQSVFGGDGVTLVADTFTNPDMAPHEAEHIANFDPDTTLAYIAVAEALEAVATGGYSRDYFVGWAEHHDREAAACDTGP